MSAEDIIHLLNLQPLPFEGGWYRETYRSEETIGAKSMATAIYYLITPTTYSKLHRLPTDEVFHFYLGDPVRQLNFRPDGTAQIIMLGNDLARNQKLQWHVPAGTWQGSCLHPGGQFALLGTTMSPGFDPADLEMAHGDELLQAYPGYLAEIKALMAN